MELWFAEFCSSPMVCLMIIILSGCLLGRIHWRGISLGASAVLLTGLLFGHFGFVVNSVFKNWGLICFVAAVGYSAGPVFFRIFKQKAFRFIILSVSVVVTGLLLMFVMILVTDLPAGLALGLFNGALTSTPGLAAATEAMGNDALVGYGIAYPFGVLCVILFIQLVPRLLKVDLKIMAREKQKHMAVTQREENDLEQKSLWTVDKLGLFNFFFILLLGMALAQIKIPLWGGGTFSLGNSGGPLLVGLFIGNWGRCFKLSMHIPKSTLSALQEMGLLFFLAGAGSEAGQSVVAVLQQYGILLFVLGAVITIIPLFLGYVLARHVFGLDLLDTLGAICGSMTSTPSLGVLVQVSENDLPAAIYAVTYPIALVMMILSSQLTKLLFG